MGRLVPDGGRDRGWTVSTADILDAAADIVEHNGWNQGDYYRPEGGKQPQDCPVDTTGALNLALGADTPSHDIQPDSPAEVALMKYLGIEYVPGWNDAPDRTAEQVIAALRSAAAAERERGA